VLYKLLVFTDWVTPSHPVSSSKLKTISFNDSIGILLRSYARAINKQEQRVGALFREETKAECVTPIEGITPSFYNTSSGTLIQISNPEIEYPQICFNYIHFNPVVSHLVDHPEEWEFSSYRDYCGIRDGKLINRVIAKEFGRNNFFFGCKICSGKFFSL
jgi:putative transposase